jgi:hypothetical protein
MHRLFLLRAYGDFVILLQALLESPQKNKYSLIAFIYSTRDAYLEKMVEGLDKRFESDLWLIGKSFQIHASPKKDG